MNESLDNATQEIIDQAKEDELDLPYAAEIIAQLERIGAVVDLRTGEITFEEADQRDIILTLLGFKYAEALSTENSNRDKNGRFVSGNKWSSVGFQAFVDKNFGGDTTAAKEWLGQLGVWVYGQQSLNPYFQVKDCFLKHPGTPSEFMQRRDFTLDDVPEIVSNRKVAGVWKAFYTCVDCISKPTLKPQRLPRQDSPVQEVRQGLLS